MRCISPIKAGFNSDGDLTFSNRKRSKELEAFEFECRKCLPCRLNTAREKAVRCYHESQMHEENIFLTLTYDHKNLTSERLQYEDWQTFIRSLRDHVRYRKGKTTIPTFHTGEYGDETKRPHWHAIIFNYRPDDQIPLRKTELGEQIYTSETLTELWGKGKIEYGSCTIDSANYVARYAAKKLIHGKDQDHDFHPIHKTSSKHAIGKKWIEKYWQQTFLHGYVRLPNGTQTRIPRYYVDWLKKHHPLEWEHYVTEVRPKIQKQAEIQARKEELIFLSNLWTWNGMPKLYPLPRNKINLTILENKFKILQENNKL